jgi:hypothetical protein
VIATFSPIRAFLSMIARSITTEFYRLRAGDNRVDDAREPHPRKSPPHEHRIPNGCSALDHATNPDHSPFDVCIRDDTAIGQDRMTDGRGVNFTGWKKPRISEYRCRPVKEVERRKRVGQGEVRFEKRADRADILPITWKYKPLPCTAAATSELCVCRSRRGRCSDSRSRYCC